MSNNEHTGSCSTLRPITARIVGKEKTVKSAGVIK